MKVLLLFAGLCAASALAQEAKPVAQGAKLPANASIYTVTHVDLMPDHLGGVGVLDAYVAQELKDPGVRHVELLQSVESPNHFTLVETFSSRDAYDRHVEGAYTRKFRTELLPSLGSPYDERLFRDHSVR